MNLELNPHPVPTDITQRGRAIIGDMARALPFSGLGIASQIDGIVAPQIPNPNTTTATPMDGLGGYGGGLLGPGSALGDLLAQLMAMLSQLFGGASSPGSPSGESNFMNATGSSNGDPHLGFNGAQSNGTNVSGMWNSMTGHSDLLDSDSFSGGYQLSTQTTQPNAQGITYNQSATLTSGWGGTSVSLDNAGNATITQNGTSYPLAIGQNIDLGNGENAVRNSDGSLAITMNNGSGGSITTTMRQNGQGVDVSATATNVDLGGDLVNGAQPIPAPIPTPAPPPPGGIRDPIRYIPMR